MIPPIRKDIRKMIGTAWRPVRSIWKMIEVKRKRFGWTIDRGRMFANEVTVVPVKPYGPGRYDPVYEEGNVDYPIGYVRWTENRNQALFLQLLAEGKVRVAPLAPVHVPIDHAPEAYELLMGEGRPPTVVLSYPDA